jgi:hypothetical protein
LVIQFRDAVLIQTLHQRSAFILVQRLDNNGFLCDFRIPATVEPVEVRQTVVTKLNWLIRDVSTEDQFSLISQVTSIDGEVTKAVRLTPLDGWQKFISLIPELAIAQIKVVLRGDWILDEKNRGLDGHHIWPGVPEGPTAAIGADGQPINGRPSGDGTEGGDWISIIHIQSQK